MNGTNRNNNNTRVDGAADVFVWLPHATLYVPPEETIETVNITTGSFDAEQGMAGGAAVTVTTKSGTNAFTASPSRSGMTTMLQARNFFYYGNGTPFSLHNIDGGTLGGPIVKNKLFFFGSWEGTRERTNYSALSTVPTVAERNGDFSAFGTAIYDPSTGDCNRKRAVRRFRTTLFPQNRINPDHRKASKPDSAAESAGNDFQLLQLRHASAGSRQHRCKDRLEPHAESPHLRQVQRDESAGELSVQPGRGRRHGPLQRHRCGYGAHADAVGDARP